jgi:hypothetical protein
MMLQEKIRSSEKGALPRTEPTGDFSQFFPPEDPIRLELESLFPPFTGPAQHRQLQCAYCHRSFVAEQLADPAWTCPAPLNERRDGRCFFRS